MKITEFLCLINFHKYKVTELAEDNFLTSYNPKVWNIWEQCNWCGTEKATWTSNKALVNKLQKELESEGK